MFSHETEILRKMRFIEWLKAEIIANVGYLYQAMAKNSEQAIKEGLASLIILCYILARRLGISFGELDEIIMGKIGDNIRQEHEAERLFGDFTACQRYLQQRR
ncbi:MazG-like family protein [Propionispora vibrioides]|uniref:MazG-like family protein n=1 Tax=Propionispora vibrioides TaxID=112903 RepID=A0A1H8XKH3_9FIRM|nr:MazG-like family protein [Propionispora vibrioides]SEP40262.1 MazG-like family protein [Propionispora vibrioides]